MTRGTFGGGSGGGSGTDATARAAAANAQTTANSKLAAVGATSTQTASFTAAAQNYYRVDATNGAVTVTLPTSNTATDIISIQKIDATANLVSYVGTIAGVANTTGSLRTQSQGKLLQGDGTGNWNIIAGDVSVSALDGRYATIASLTPAQPSASATNTAIILDTFTGADSTNLTAHAADTSAGNSWLLRNGAWNLRGNALVSTNTQAGNMATIDAPGTAGNFTITADVTPTFETANNAACQPGILFSYVDANNYFYFTPTASASAGTGSLALIRVTAGVATTLLKTSFATVPNGGVVSSIRVDRNGPDITVSFNGVEFGSVYDTQGMTSISHGVRLDRAANPPTISTTWDNFKITPFRAAAYNWPKPSKDAANPIFTINTANRTDTVSYTSGSSTVTDSSILATDHGRPLKTASGIPSGTYVGTVTAGVSFLLSSSPTSQVAVNATATVSGGSLILGNWNGTDLNDPSVAYDPVNNRWVMAATSYFNDSTDTGIQNLGVYYATSLSGPWTPDAANPVLADAVAQKYNMNGALVWYLDHWIYVSGYFTSHGNSSGFAFYTSPDLHTWTKLANIFQPGATGSFDQSGCFDAFLRVRQDGVTLELTYAAVGPNGVNRKIGQATSLDGGNTWNRKTVAMLNPPLWDAGGDLTTSNFFAEPSVYVPPGKEGQQMLVFFDTSQTGSTTTRRIGMALTVDGGTTWHYRLFSTAGTGWESVQNFDSMPAYHNGMFHFFYGGANVAGSSLNLNIQIGHQSTAWDASSLLVSAATG